MVYEVSHKENFEAALTRFKLLKESVADKWEEWRVVWAGTRNTRTEKDVGTEWTGAGESITKAWGVGQSNAWQFFWLWTLENECKNG